MPKPDHSTTTRASDQNAPHTIEIALDRNGFAHVRADEILLDSIALPSIDIVAFAREIHVLIDQLTQGSTVSQKLRRYETNIRQIGLRLGGLLFGRDDMLKGQDRGDTGNALDRLFAGFYGDDRWCSITLAAEDPIVESFPWELALWLHGTEITLGTDSQLAFARRAHYRSYVQPRTEPPRGDRLRLTHVTSAQNKNTTFYREHRGIRAFFRKRDLAEDHFDVDIKYSADWNGRPGQDIFHFLGHGCPGALVWEANGPDGHSGGELDIDPDTLAGLFNGRPLPSLIILLSCSGFDRQSETNGGMLWQLLQMGGASVIGMLGSIKIGHGDEFIKLLYGGLFQHGRLDRAVQTIRAFIRSRERLEALSADYRLDTDWFRPVLCVRDVSALSRFTWLTEDRFSAPGQGDPMIRQVQDKISRTAKELFSPVEFGERTELRKVLGQLNQRLERMRDAAVHELQANISDLTQRVSKLEFEARPGLLVRGGDESEMRELRDAWDNAQWEFAAYAVACGIPLGDLTNTSSQ